MRKPPLSYLLLWALGIVLIVGCSNPQDQFIQGKWARGNVHYWEEWNFSDGRYRHIYDDTHDHREETGRFLILEVGENHLLLELYDQQGALPSIEDRVTMKITLDHEQDTIHIGRGDFARVTTSTLEELATAQAP
jgi:hypothetical protein